MRFRHIVATAGVALAAACAATPDPDPQLISLRADIDGLQADPFAMASAETSINNADAALTRAETAFFANKREAFTHETRTATAYVQLARVKTDVARTEEAIDGLNDERSDVEVALANKGVRDAQRIAAAARAEALAARRENSELREKLETYEMRETEAGAQLVLQELMFELDSDVLREGAQQRLQPLADYLVERDTVQVRIDGHTDNTGDADYNRELSLKRANAVAAFLASQGVAASRIETFGYGEDKPIASNDTNSGREENRRVEVTLSAPKPDAE